MSRATDVHRALRAQADPEKAAFYPRFFRTGPGEYGEGDEFYGVTVPKLRRIAKQFRDLPSQEIERLLDHRKHEARLVALFVLVDRYQRGDEGEREQVVRLYLRKIDRVNSWDLVDGSAPKILGAHLYERDRGLLDELAGSGDLWKQRIAILATLYFIQQGDLEETLRLADELLEHPHDLIHKAVGWMLREVGKRNEEVMLEFLSENYERMPRTALRYAIEKLSKERRQRALRGEFG